MKALIEFLNEGGLYRDKIKLHGNKIKVAEVFSHDTVHAGSVDSEISKKMDVYVDDKTFEKNPIEDIDVTKIVPTQRFITVKNLDTVNKEEQDNTGAYVVKIKDLYYIIDGHHRIANKIINGDISIKAYVHKVK